MTHLIWQRQSSKKLAMYCWFKIKSEWTVTHTNFTKKTKQKILLSKFNMHWGHYGRYQRGKKKKQLKKPSWQLFLSTNFHIFEVYHQYIKSNQGKLEIYVH